ncbi:hypothetical protein V5N11_008967 [Cardamine amara subsp. amara]|uniref:DNA-3-methyladenine glycosylase I n=1 Tax=Cardamine amara subsp. amara TaxID=228776 RepID=A0ABD1A6A9_CARAN
MYKASPKRRVVNVEKSKSVSEKETKQNSNFFAKHLKRIYPIALQRSTSSSFSLSSISLSLSQNSTDSFSTDSSTLEQKISLALGLIASPHRRETFVPKSIPQQQEQQLCHDFNSDDHEPKRCYWITKKSDEVYVTFHDQQWGVPVYDDKLLFEFLAMSGMLMDYNWTEILKRKELFREAFCEFDPNMVAKMGEKEITEIASNKAIMLQESRVRCIVDNAKCIIKVVKEFGSFSSFMWGFMDYKPIINKFKYSRNAAGLTIDHLVDCYRHGDCVSLAERPWRHI